MGGQKGGGAVPVEAVPVGSVLVTCGSGPSGAQHLTLLSSPHPIFRGFFGELPVSLVELVWCADVFDFRKRPNMHTLGVLGTSCEAPAAQRRSQGSRKMSRESQMVLICLGPTEDLGGATAQTLSRR